MENIKKVTRQCGIASYFDCMVSGVDLKESKPDPAIYLDTLRRLNLKPEEVIAIEDSTYGIQACIGANIRVIAKEANRYDFNQDLADVIASDILDAYNIIKYWNLEENYFFCVNACIIFWLLVYFDCTNGMHLHTTCKRA